MRRISSAALAIAVAVVLASTQRSSAGTQVSDDLRDRGSCSVRTLKGAYGIQIQGTRPTSTGATESVIGITIRHYDGNGNFTQVGNEKGSATGNAPADREAFGTYQVNEDCTGTHELQIPGLAFLITDRFVIVDFGRELRSYVVNPAPAMVSGVGQKIGFR
jgi:hypothetical protein